MKRPSVVTDTGLVKTSWPQRIHRRIPFPQSPGCITELQTVLLPAVLEFNRSACENRLASHGRGHYVLMLEFSISLTV